MSLSATLDVDADADAVRFTLSVRNEGTDAVELTFRSAQTADVVVRDGDAVVWRWSDGRMFAQLMRDRSLAPEETLRETVEWPDPERGSYVARGTLESTPDAEAEARFSV